TRLKCEDDRTDGDDCGTRDDNRSLRADGVQQFAPGDLTEQARETTRGQHETDIFLVPFLVGEISRHIGTEPGEDTGNEEVDRVEAAETGRRRRRTSGAEQCCRKRHLSLTHAATRSKAVPIVIARTI